MKKVLLSAIMCIAFVASTNTALAQDTKGTSKQKTECTKTEKCTKEKKTCNKDKKESAPKTCCEKSKTTADKK